MKRFVAALCACVLCLTLFGTAFASNFYIVPDSNTRRMTREELWGWQYEALGYIFNEIFARHGYHFKPGERYDNYFRAQLWYKENQTYRTNEEIHKHLMGSVDWYNEHLIKEVRAEMRALGTTNPGGKGLPAIAYEPPIYGAFSSFREVYFAPNQKLAVYSGPGTQYYRAADGKAMASTNGQIYVGGVENGWLMVMYWTNNGNVRVGYVNTKDFKDTVQANMLSFAYTPATTTRQCVLTDDPVATYLTTATLPAGTPVTYLSEYVNEYRWAYVEATVGGQTMRGFVSVDAVATSAMEVDEPSVSGIELNF